MATIALTVNGRAHVVDVEPRTLLVELLRERLRLTGTHVGCDTSQCGACTVWVDGKSVKSCAMLAVEAEGAAVTTIEGLAVVDPSHRQASAAPRTPLDISRLHPMQAAFNACHGLQCGFCTPGMVMSATELVRRNPDPSEGEIRHWLEGNLCRCTGYHNIVRAVLEAATVLRAGGGGSEAVPGAAR
jgi:carbon-monoxide dehydrogenase small subunit